MKKLLKLLIGLAALLPLTMMAVEPTVETYLEQWTRTYAPVAETCTGGYCGSSNSIHPQLNYQTSIYNRLDNGVVTKSRLTFSDPGPVYHSQCTTVSTLVVSNGVSAGKLESWCNDPGQAGYTNTLSELDLAEERTRGTLKTGTVHVDYRNTNSIVDSCRIALKHGGGNTGFVYTYRIYFTVEEKVRNANLQLVSNGFVPYTQISMPGRVVYNGSDVGPYYCFTELQFGGGHPTAKVNVTPSCNRPYYVISEFAPVLWSVVEK